jgi:hypothetical protein
VCWLRAALQASIPATRVTIVLWYLAGRERSREVRPTWQEWRRFGLSPDTGRRGLVSLEDAGLVTIERHSGRCPIVTILDVSE